jgi:hypothetical protein
VDATSTRNPRHHQDAARADHDHRTVSCFRGHPRLAPLRFAWPDVRATDVPSTRLAGRPANRAFWARAEAASACGRNDLLTHRRTRDTDERKLANALAVGADGVVADLEDSVTDAQKELGAPIRARPRDHDPPCARLRRVSEAGSDPFERDVALAGRLELNAIVLPKATRMLGNARTTPPSAPSA